MKKINNITNNNQGYSILIAIFMVGFLLVLTTGVFNLVLGEMNSNRGVESYFKSYAGVEGSIELAMLNIKENGYGFDKDLGVNTGSGNEVLAFSGAFREGKDPKISYNMDVATIDYNGILGTGATDIIPLFTTSGSVNMYAEHIYLTVTAGSGDNLIWNIIGDQEGLSGTGAFDHSDFFSYREKGGGYQNGADVGDFLSPSGYGTTNTGSYLMLYNKSTSDVIKYYLKENMDGRAFSKPTATVTASVEVGGYKQNITTEVNNSKFLNMLKYSIYSQ